MDEGRKGRSRTLAPAQYAALAEFRFALRQFTAFSAAAATRAGLPPQQHQALLVIKGSREPVTVGALAARLLVAPHTAAELAKRLAEAGHVVAVADPDDRRRHVLALTGKAEALLAELSDVHLKEITELAPRLADALAVLTGSKD